MNKTKLPVSAIAIFLIAASCGGNESSTSGSKGRPAIEVVSGEAVYKRTCITCHQANGAGVPNAFPPLAKSDFLADKDKAITQVIKGQMGEMTVNGAKYNGVMPPQALNDEEVAAVLTYVYGNFGNSGGAITPADVKAVRAKL